MELLNDLDSPDLGVKKYYGVDREAGAAKAEAEGLFVYEPDAYTIVLDIDNPGPWNPPVNVVKILEREYNDGNPIRVNTTVSRGGNTHVYIRVQSPMNDDECIAIQAALGSDPVKELLSLVAVRNGLKKPILMFEIQEPEFLKKEPTF